MKIVFFGTSQFASHILSFLLKHHLTIVAIVTRPDRPFGRSLILKPPPVKEIAQNEASHISLLQPEKASTEEFAKTLRDLQPDLFLVVAYGEILKRNLLEIPKKGSINIHASLLPKYRGAAPIQRSLMNGEKETGISIIEMVLEMDAGDILAEKKIPIPLEMTFGELEEALWRLSCPLTLEVLNQIENNRIKKITQNLKEVTFAPKILPSEEKIDWNQSAFCIHNQIRALSPFPGAWCFIQWGKEKKRLKIKRSKIIENRQGDPGENLFFGKEGWIVACQENSLSLLEVQLEGKKAMTIQEFVRGVQEIPQIIL